MWAERWEELRKQNRWLRQGELVLARHERLLPLLSFGAGSAMDAITLGRIDQWPATLQMLGYLLLLFGLVFVIHGLRTGLVRQPLLVRMQGWMPHLAQFLLGGLYSAYAIYYFQSASFSKNLIFVGILLSLGLAVEYLKLRLSDPRLFFALLYLATASYLAFFLPILFRFLSVWLFVAATLLALVCIGLLWGLLLRLALLDLAKPWQVMVAPMVFCCLLNLLYQANLVPPVPLSLKSAGLYHNLQVQGQRYAVDYEKPPWWRFWSKYSGSFHLVPGDTIYVLTPIFAPTGLEEEVYHQWYWLNPHTKDWIFMDRIPLGVKGGRDAGYRGYSKKRQLSQGEWKILVTTSEGLTLGRLRFTLEMVAHPEYELVQEYF